MRVGAPMGVGGWVGWGARAWAGGAMVLASGERPQSDPHTFFASKPLCALPPTTTIPVFSQPSTCHPALAIATRCNSPPLPTSCLTLHPSPCRRACHGL